MFNQLLMLQRLQYIQNDENQAACPSHSYYLSSSALAILGSFNDTRQIQQLQQVSIYQL